MTPRRILLSSLLIAEIAVGFGFRFWSKSELPFPNETLTDLEPHPDDPTKVLAASQGKLYLRGENRSWKQVLFLPEKSVALQQLFVHPRLIGRIFLLAKEGVLEGNLKNGQTRWLFREKNSARNQIHDLVLHPEDPHLLYLGTERGLFRSSDGGRSWRGPHRWPENQPVEFVGFLPSPSSTFFLGTPRELFFSKDDGDTFESGFSLPLKSEENGEDIEEEEFEEHSRLARFTSQAFRAKDPSRLWMGTREGVFESRDGGIDWTRLPDRGLEDCTIRDLLFSDRREALIAATPKGVFQYHPDERRWEKIPIGLAQPPTSLAIQTNSKNEEVLLTASGGQIVEWVLGPSEVSGSESVFVASPERLELFRRLVTLEPTIREVQKKAIHYGNLGNGKIRRWHWGSRLRAFIPRLTFGRDLSISQNIDIDRGGTNDADRFILGPSETDEGWDLGVTWELGDFLYSSAQTSIDSRAKLLVELRESILSEVTRIYFERRRIQMEIALSSAPATLQEKFDLLLRLDELTAQLDALTDGYLSRELEKLEQGHPELKELFF